MTDDDRHIVATQLRNNLSEAVERLATKIECEGAYAEQRVVYGLSDAAVAGAGGMPLGWSVKLVYERMTSGGAPDVLDAEWFFAPRYLVPDNAALLQ